MTPHSVHYGTARAIHATRQTTLDGALLAHPNRFKGKKPQSHSLPTAVWINPPAKDSTNLHKPQPHTELLSPGAAKSLTRSGRRPEGLQSIATMESLTRLAAARFKKL